MNLTLTAQSPCWQCGHLGTWIKVDDYRVNKNTLVSTGRGLMARPSRCGECGADRAQDTIPEEWVLDKRSAERVADARAKRGWT